MPQTINCINISSLIRDFTELMDGVCSCDLNDLDNEYLLLSLVDEHSTELWLNQRLTTEESKENTFSLLETLTTDPDINQRAVQYFSLIEKISKLSAHPNLILLIAEQNFANYIQDQLEQNSESIKQISNFIQWSDLANQHRMDYQYLDLGNEHTKIGIDGVWLYQA